MVKAFLALTRKEDFVTLKDGFAQFESFYLIIDTAC